MVIEVANEEERKIVDIVLREIRAIGTSGVITIMRESLMVMAWANGRKAGQFTMDNVPKNWRDR